MTAAVIGHTVLYNVQKACYLLTQKTWAVERKGDRTMFKTLLHIWYSYMHLKDATATVVEL